MYSFTKTNAYGKHRGEGPLKQKKLKTATGMFRQHYFVTFKTKT